MAQFMEGAKAHHWGKWAALVAVLTLLFQTVAIPPARAGTMELCTAHGTKTVLVAKDGPAVPMDCEHCGHCVLSAPPANVPTASLQAPVRYFAAAYLVPASVETSAHGARAPPRPPGQGPPNL